jgi:hypothetical protein
VLPIEMRLHRVGGELQILGDLPQAITARRLICRPAGSRWCRQGAMTNDATLPFEHFIQAVQANWTTRRPPWRSRHAT